MKYEDFTKTELIRFLRHNLRANEQRDTHRMMMYRYDDLRGEWNEQSTAALAALNRYINLLTPYAGERMIDIPHDVLAAANAAQKKHTMLDKQADKTYKRMRDMEKIMQGELAQ